MNKYVLLIASLLILAVLIPDNVYGQTSDEINALKIYPGDVKSNHFIDSSRVNHSEYDLIFGLVFRLYKHHISSQDAGNCAFHPSCSEYALLAIQKQGIIIGIINSIDRISRCNKRSFEYYLHKTDDGLIIDPVRNIGYVEK